MPSLYTTHSPPLSVLYADIERFALEQRVAFVGTPGSINTRENASGFRFYAHQSYDGTGKQRERYIAGPVGAEDAERAAGALRERIDEMKAIVPSLRLLGREGFNLVDARTYATLAVLHNHAVFASGGLLVGSHAYGVILNRLGVRAAAYTTLDVDLARPKALSFETRPDVSLLEMLRETGIAFHEVPGLDRKSPATSFGEAGRSRFHVDLLGPSGDESFPTLPVPELRAHATGMPYLGYLLKESQSAVAMTRTGCCAVRVPLPERFAVHKLIVSRLRVGRDAKTAKDLQQACVLAAVLGDHHPGALEAAVADVPRRAAKHLRKALVPARDTLAAESPRALEELRRAVDSL